MKEKSQIEKKAEEKQITLLSTALSEASNAGGHWLNASGKGYPRFYPKGVSVSAFNALFMTLHSDKNGCKTNQFTLFSDAKAQGASVRENEQGVPFLFYNWNKYVHRNNPEQVISRDDYMKLYEEEQKLYKGVHNREIRTLFNIDQTTLPYVDKERYETTLRRYGSAVERGYTEADNRRLHIQFNEMIQDDKKRWALYIKPENKSGYSIYPDKEDINRFFSTLKQAMDNIGKVRMELAHKYYALAEVKPDLKVDLFSSEMPEIDLNRIQRVSVFKTKQDGIQCVATIDGQKQPARSVTPQQWQRMWIAEERDSYKRHLAATLFADVLQKGQSQEAHTGEKQQKEAELWPIETVAQERTESDNKGISPERQLWDKLKANHPDALQLLRTKDGYRLYNEDAVQGAKILGITLKEYPEGDITASTEFSTEQLDNYLSKLVRAGARVAISDMEEQETHRGFHR